MLLNLLLKISYYRYITYKIEKKASRWKNGKRIISACARIITLNPRTAWLLSLKGNDY